MSEFYDFDPVSQSSGERALVWVVHGIVGSRSQRRANVVWWDSLIANLFPSSTIFDYRPGYDAGSGRFRDILIQESRELSRHIYQEVADRGAERILLVGYDIGGAILKQAINHAIREAPQVAQRISLLVFFGTPHRARSRSLWREIVYNLVSESSIRLQEPRREIANALRELSQPLEIIPGLFGVCNGSHGRHHIVGPYAASLGLPITREYRFSWPTDMNFSGNLQDDLGQQILDNTPPRPGCVNFLSKLLRIVPQDGIAWDPPAEIEPFIWLTQDYNFTSWLDTDDGTLSLRGRSMNGLSDASSYLARYMADLGRDTVVAKFAIGSSARRTTESELLAGIIYQILCQRPSRFLDIEHECHGLHDFPANRLRVFLGLILASENGNGENFVIVINRIDGSWEGNGSPLAVLGEVQDFSPFRIIATSRTGVEMGGRNVLELPLPSGAGSSASSQHSSILSSPRHNVRPLSPIRRRRNRTSRRRTANRASSRVRFAGGATPPSENPLLPLHAACESGSLFAIRRALRRGFDIQATDSMGSTPLHVACRHNQAEAARELLHRQADVLARDHEGSSPIHVACYNNAYTVIHLLLSVLQERLPIDGSLRTPLHAVALNGAAEVFREVLNHYLACWAKVSPAASLLALGQLLLTSDVEGRNVLHIAANRGSLEMVEEILIRAASDNNQFTRLGLEQSLLRAKDVNAELPLHLAARHGHSDVVRMLCTKMTEPKDISTGNKTGKTPLHLACLMARHEVVAELLSFRADIEATDDHEITAIAEAAKAGSMDTVLLLVDGGASLLPTKGSSPLYEAVVSQNEDLATSILGAAANKGQDLRRKVDANGRLPIMWAARKGHRSLFDRLLADLGQLSIKDTDRNSVLHYAAEGGNMEILSMLLGKRWLRSHVNSPNRMGHTPLQLAAKAGHVEVVDALLQDGAQPVASRAISFAATDEIGLQLLGRSAGFVETSDLVDILHNAARRGHLRTVRTIMSPDVAINPSPNCINSGGRTALSLAAEAGRTEVVQYLAARVNGVDINLRDDCRRTPISYAAENGHVGVLQLLASYGDIDLIDETGRSPLAYAAFNGHLAAVKVLESAYRARFWLVDSLSSGLCAAAEGGHEIVVGFLLRKGANPGESYPSVIAPANLPQQPLNALEHALLNGNVEVISLLADAVPEALDLHRLPRLQLACRHPNGLREYLRRCRDVESPDQHGTTALSFAVQNGHLESALVLLESKADPTRRDLAGKTPLHYAVVGPGSQSNERQILDGEFAGLLLGYMAPQSINIQDRAGNTPLIDAVRAGAIHSVRALLIKDNTSIKFPASEGHHSPLWIALQTGAFQIARLILELADLRVLTGSHRELVVVASRRAPNMQLQLIKALPSIQTRLDWVQELVKNDTTGVIVRHLLDQQGADTGRVDDHGWSLADFAYATDPRRCWDKSDEEITRTATQVYGRPGRWLPVGEDGYPYLQIYGGGVMVRYLAPYGHPATQVAAVRADHPVPPHRAYYFEIQIVNAGQNPQLLGVGLCTADTTIPNLALLLQQQQQIPMATASTWAPTANLSAYATASASDPAPASALAKTRQSLRYLYYGNGLVEKSGRPFAAADGFGTGDVIGCHMDLGRGIAYFRKNGRRTGIKDRQHEMLPVSGRLFPVLVTASSGCEVVAGFDQASSTAAVWYAREEARDESDAEA